MRREVTLVSAAVLVVQEGMFSCLWLVEKLLAVLVQRVLAGWTAAQ